MIANKILYSEVSFCAYMLPENSEVNIFLKNRMLLYVPSALS